mmetsp:Transcript_8985/g.29776  ORF Transcript_8985/g.29776 Transcript_8985/m.29776 type:complete len:222 (-) Transcript_8985:792-1457(-)
MSTSPPSQQETTPSSENNPAQDRLHIRLVPDRDRSRRLWRGQVRVLLDYCGRNRLDGAAGVLDLHVKGGQRQRPGGCVKADERVHLVDGADQPLLNQHGGGDALGLVGVDAEKLGELDKGDVVVQSRGSQHVVLDDRAVEDRGRVFEPGFLVAGQGGGEGLNLISSEETVHHHLLQHTEAVQARRPLVLVQRAQQPRPLRPGRRQDGAGDGHLQRGGQVLL